MKRIKKIFTIVLVVMFFVSLFAVYCIAGNLEQGIITNEQAMLHSVIVVAVLLFSGFKSGLLRLADRR